MNKVAITGGGIGGLALANAFQKQGIDYQLFESSQKFGEVGAGIGISESTIEILDKFDMGPQVRGQGKYIKEAVIVDKNRQVIRKLPIVNGGFSIHRAKLVDILAKNVDLAKVNFNHRLTQINTDGRHAEVIFQGGEKKKFDCLVACDGINSVIRHTFFPHIKKRYSGQTIWRGITSCQLPSAFHEVYLEFWGDNLRFATIPMSDSQYYWYAVRYAPAGEQDKPDTQKEDLIRLFKNYFKEVKDVIQSSPYILRNDMWDLEPAKRAWHYQNIVFLGDAIHATTPNLAQGGCQAIEDAYTLSLCIKKYGLNEKAFKRYTQLRIDKVNYIVNQSWRFGQSAHQGNFVSEQIIKFIFKNLIPNSYFVKQYQKLIDLDYLAKV
jgi:2-polyprenyl-6-methoxyphenol hydroxylase-like FAD-dependent oxidoreductase